MGLYNWLNRNRINPSDKKQKWEDTDEGKDFMERYKASLEKRKLLKEEWERTTPPEKKEQVKLFQVIFPIFFLLFSREISLCIFISLSTLESLTSSSICPLILAAAVPSSLE